MQLGRAAGQEMKPGEGSCQGTDKACIGHLVYVEACEIGNSIPHLVQRGASDLGMYSAEASNDHAASNVCYRDI